MPAVTPRDARFPESSGARYTEALLGLTRTLWQPQGTLQSALGVLCETAAETLQVERCNVWMFEDAVFEGDPRQLRCLHAYFRPNGHHAGPEELEVLRVSRGYVQLLEQARSIDALDVTPDHLANDQPMQEYWGRHGIQAQLDAPVRAEGRLVGVFCHEDTSRPRAWTPEEFAFAASMGDWVALVVENDRRHVAERRIEHLRLHDATTDLPNRDYLFERLRMRLHDPNNRLAVVHVEVHLPYGAALPEYAPTVEEVMAEVARRLRRAFGSTNTLVRARADAFVLLPDRDLREHEVVRIAQKCVDTVRGLSGWRAEVEPGSAVGVAFAHDMPEADARLLLRNAELASQRARSHGRHHYEVFNIEHHQVLLDRLHVEHAIREALANDGFCVHYQPEFDLDSGRWVAAEALLRWRQPGQVVAAEAFIEIAETSGLILPLGRQVLQRACCDARDWPSVPAPLTLRVNVSALQFDDPALVDEVAAALAESGLPAQQLCLELTETTLMSDTGVALDTMERLQALGITFAIDDFGTGYSSLARLRRFPIGSLKIDRSFVAGLPDQAEDCAIVAAISGLARALGLEVVAEGVEQVEQRDALHQLGLHRMQGWLYSKALDQAAMQVLLATTPVAGHA